MDIASAIKQVRNTVIAYMARDERGLRRVPLEAQRPIILMGPPGVGKTAIVAQVAEEMGINFLSYSITHHTRQSALGLPFITERNYGGRTFKTSEYTMSEIIGAAYESIEASGVAEGILFLDEVNCVSETLAPSMLQFLQFKTFGQHRLPEGWIVVAAGNPPEYNKVAREFDAATLDRVKCIHIEPNLTAWQDYALSHGVHAAIVAYLDCKPSHFYQVRNDVSRMGLVTARGWVDLSRVVKAYEAEQLEVDMELISQYLQDEEVAASFAVYYKLFKKYRVDYSVSEILEGKVSEEMADRAGAARFDERIALMGLIFEALRESVHDAVCQEEALELVRGFLVKRKAKFSKTSTPSTIAKACRGEAAKSIPSSVKVTGDRDAVQARRSSLLEDLAAEVLDFVPTENSRGNMFEVVKELFNARCALHEQAVAAALSQVDFGLQFVEEVLAGDQELLIIATRMSADLSFMKLFGRYGSDSYTRVSKQLLLSERRLKLLDDIESVERVGRLLE